MAINTDNGKKGFTLVEILIVISIMSLLLTLVLPRYFGSIELSKKEVQIQNIRAIQSSIDRYYHDKGVYPDNLETLVGAGYLKSIPIDPSTKTNTSWIPQYQTINGSQQLVDVRSSHPIQMSNP